MSKKDETWLVSEATKWNLPEPTAVLSKTGKQWSLLSRGNVVGRLKPEQVTDRQEELIEKMCEQVSVVQADLGRALNAPWAEISTNLHIARERVDEILNRCTNVLLLHDATGDKSAPKPKIYEITGIIEEEIIARKKEELNKLKTKKVPKAEAEQKERSIAFIEASTNLKLSSYVRGSIERRAESMFSTWSKDRRNRRFPHARQGQPIGLKASSWSVERDKGSFVIDIKIMEGRGGHYKLKIHPSGGSAIAMVRELTDGTATKRDAKLIWNRDRKCWVVAMTIGRKRRPPPKLGDEPLVMVVRIGMRSLLSAWFSNGRMTEIIAGKRTGETLKGILARKQQMLSVKRDKQRGMLEMRRGPNAVRRLNRGGLAKLGKKEEAYVKTTCEQIAAFVANTAQTEGATRVIVQIPAKPFSDEDAKYLDDWLVKVLRRFPMSMLANKIVWALDKRGLPSEISDLGYDACTCPDCGVVDGKSHNPKNRSFECTGCGLQVAADMIAAMNALQRCGVSRDKMDKAIATMKAMTRELQKKKESFAA